jgi:hypothetical protein
MVFLTAFREERDYDSEAIRHPGHFLGFTQSIKYGQHPNAQEHYNRNPLIWMPQLQKS